LLEINYEDAAVGMIGIARGRDGLAHRISGRKVFRGSDFSRVFERLKSVITLGVNVGVNAVSQRAGLILLDAHVMRARSSPDCVPLRIEPGRAPNAKMISFGDNLDGHAIDESEVLWAAEKIELANRHFGIGLVRHGFLNGVDDGVLC